VKLISRKTDAKKPITKQMMRDETERLVKDALVRKILTVKQCRARIEAKCRKCGASKSQQIQGRSGCHTGVRKTEKLEKVLEKLATTDKATLVVEKAPEGKIHVTSESWSGEKVILQGRVLEVRNIEGAARHAQDPPQRRLGPADLAYIPYGRGNP
jgi:hypothetical protein